MRREVRKITRIQKKGKGQDRTGYRNGEERRGQKMVRTGQGWKQNRGYKARVGVESELSRRRVGVGLDGKGEDKRNRKKTRVGVESEENGIGSELSFGIGMKSGI